MDTKFVIAPNMSKQFFNGLDTYLPNDVQLIINNDTDESTRDKIAFQKKLAHDYISGYTNTLAKYQEYANEFNPHNHNALGSIDRRKKRLDEFNNIFNNPKNYPNYLGKGAYDRIHETIQPQLDYKYDELNKDNNNAYLTSLGNIRKNGEEAFLTNKLDIFPNRPNIDEQKAVLQQNLKNLDIRLMDLNDLARETEAYKPLDMFKPKQEIIANEINEEQEKIKEIKKFYTTQLNDIEQPGYGERGCVIV